MLKELGRRRDEHREKFNKGSENIKENQTVTETKNTPEGINRGLDNTEEQISNLKYGIVEITQAKQKKKKGIKK